MLHPPRPFFQRKKKDLSVPRTNVKMMVMLREKRVSFPITFVAKIGFANRPTTIISIALAAQKWWLHHHHHHLLKYYRENEWPSFIFFCAHLPRKMYQGKDLFFLLQCTCLSTLPACDMMDLPSWYRLSVGIVEVTNKLKTSHITFHMCWCSSNRWIGFISGIPRLLNKTAEIILQSSSNYKLTNLQLHF